MGKFCGFDIAEGHITTAWIYSCEISR